MFENAAIDTDDLPRAGDIEWQPLDPAYRRERLAVGVFVSVVLAAGIAGLTTILGMAFADENLDVSVGWLWLLWPLLAAGVVAWPFISVPRMGYAIRERDVLYKSGVVWRSVTAIPYNRIQHGETETSPLDRRFGLATLKLYTAGGSGGDLSIPGLSTDVAERLRAFVLKRIGAAVEQD